MKQIAELTDAEGVALMDALRVSTKVYNTSFHSVEDMMCALYPAAEVEPILRWQVERAFATNEWVRVGKVVDALTAQVPAVKKARWNGWSRL